MKQAVVLPLVIAIQLVSVDVNAQDSTGKYSLGLIFQSTDLYLSFKSFSPPFNKAVPVKTDLSGYFPRVGSQGGQASCVAWAVAYAMKSYQEKAERDWKRNTGRTVFSPAYVYNQIKPEGCDEGSYISDALKLLKKQGVATWASFPYSDKACDRKPSANVRDAAKEFQIHDWGRVEFDDLNDIKGFLAAGYPITVGATIYKNFMRWNSSAIYKAQEGRRVGGHAMVIVGYDDERKALRLINSWGRKWGDSGFVWVSYDLVQSGKFIKEAYVTIDEQAPKPPKKEEFPAPPASGGWTPIN
ncbi:MAG: C1 family peptidase [Rhodospirillales bacterium]|nr:C1 family peptidase [Rhodospirillales bacterium]